MKSESASRSFAVGERSAAVGEQVLEALGVELSLLDEQPDSRPVR